MPTPGTIVDSGDQAAAIDHATTLRTKHGRSRVHHSAHRPENREQRKESERRLDNEVREAEHGDEHQSYVPRVELTLVLGVAAKPEIETAGGSKNPENAERKQVETRQRGHRQVVLASARYNIELTCKESKEFATKSQTIQWLFASFTVCWSSVKPDCLAGFKHQVSHDPCSGC